MKALPIDIEKFGFVEREKQGSKTLTNRCGRDFLYYALHYYYPTKFNPENLNPVKIESQKLFGLNLPSWLMWTQLQFYCLPTFLKGNNVKLFINEKEIYSFWSFIKATILSRMTYENAINKIEESVDKGIASGIDIGLKYGGLLDHVIFIYGYDSDFLYVIDTLKVSTLEYYRLREDNKYLMRLPKKVIQARWTIFGRVWELRNNLIASVGEVTNNPKVVVGVTKFGRGLIATDDIEKGETIANFDGDIYTAKHASELPNDPPLFVKNHAVQFSDTQYRWSKFGTVLNHSCEPNCGINGISKSFCQVAMRPIKKDEELTYDYEMTEDSDWRMKCECGSPICRKMIGAYANMPPEIRLKYKGYVAKYLVNKYDESLNPFG